MIATSTTRTCRQYGLNEAATRRTVRASALCAGFSGIAACHTVTDRPYRASSCKCRLESFAIVYCYGDKLFVVAAVAEHTIPGRAPPRSFGQYSRRQHLHRMWASPVLQLDHSRLVSSSVELLL